MCGVFGVIIFLRWVSILIIIYTVAKIQHIHLCSGQNTVEPGVNVASLS